VPTVQSVRWTVATHVAMLMAVCTVWDKCGAVTWLALNAENYGKMFSIAFSTKSIAVTLTENNLF